MGRAAIRASITSYLSGASVTGLTTVYAYPPKVTPEGDIITANSDSGAVVYVHLAGQEERRIAVGGPHGGMKLRRYEVDLACAFRSIQPDEQTVGAANDAFLDSLCAAIEANRTPPDVWQWGEGDTLGAPDIRVEQNAPRAIRQQMTQIWTTVAVTAIELLNT